MNKFQDLYNFVDRAIKSRKYPEATAMSLRAALKLYESELSDDEKASLERFEKDFEQITRSVFSKNADRFSSSSLATYKSRTQKVLTDFAKYGDPIKMNSWTPKIIHRAKKVPSIAADSPQQNQSISLESDEIPRGNTHKIELALRPDTKFIIVVPRDISESEATTLKAILDSLVQK